MRSSNVVRSSLPVNFAGLLKIEASSGQSGETVFDSQTVERRPRIPGAAAEWITYYRELAGNQTEWALQSGTQSGVYGLTGTIQNAILGSSLTMAQGTYPLTLTGIVNTAGVEYVSAIHPSGNVFVSSYIGEPPNPFSIDSFIKDLHSALAQDPVVDGFKHPAEPILERGFVSKPENLAHWFERMITEHPNSPKIADTLRLLARFKPYRPEWRHQIVSIALGSSSLDVRDAAIQAVESWAEPELIDLLRAHTDAAPWLAEYAAQVVRDLSE